MDSRITDALSSCSTSSERRGNMLARSVKISVSRDRRHLAASRDFSLRFSLFLKNKKEKNLKKLEHQIVLSTQNGIYRT